MTGRYVLAADVLAMLMGAAMLVMCVLAYMDGTHDLFIEIFCAAVCFVPFVLRRLRLKPCERVRSDLHQPDSAGM